MGLDTPLGSPALVAPPAGREHARTGGFNPLARLRLGGAFALGAGRATQPSTLVAADGGNQAHDGTPGNAQLHYIVRDASGTTVLDDYQSANPATAGTWQPLQVGLRLDQGGTVEVRVETEGALGPDVYFDDVRVDHTASTIVQEQHTYAYGGPMVGLNYTVGSKNYRHGYQGQFAEKDGETGWDNFELRMYDSRIGRWNSIDPEGQFASPYVGMGNNPVSGVDPDGGVALGPPGFLQKLGAMVSGKWAWGGGYLLSTGSKASAVVTAGTRTASNAGSSALRIAGSAARAYGEYTNGFGTAVFSDALAGAPDYIASKFGASQGPPRSGAEAFGQFVGHGVGTVAGAVTTWQIISLAHHPMMLVP